MKNKIIILILTGFGLFSCNDLNLSPLSEASSENWYNNKSEIEMAINYLYSQKFWNTDIETINNVKVWGDSWTDDWTSRTNLSDITGGTINGQSNFVTTTWQTAYNCIANANIILGKLKDQSNNFDERTLNKYIALIKLARATQYAKLIFFFGDVPYYTHELTIDESFALPRTKKNEILQHLYEDYDFAAANLPSEYSGSELKYATKGAALALKARIALYMSDWKVARDASRACMDLGVYKLYPDFAKLFYSDTKNSIETIYAVPRSLNLGMTIWLYKVAEAITRINGGGDYVQPSWDLFCSFLCSDGLPIDKSPLYNPQKPFENRDPRCKATIVEFGTPHLGYIYQPHPDSLKTLNTNTKQYVSNADSRGVGQYASFNGLMWKKRVDNDWADKLTDPDDIVLRYADVLLMYAEAKIELGEIEKSVLDAMNQVRARAYGVNFAVTQLYPAITTTEQSELRKTLRIERRMEFAFESRRYYDIIRWKLAEKVLNRPIYGMLDVNELRVKVIKPGLWFFPGTPLIDNDGIADFSGMYNTNLIKLLAVRKFDASKQYLWPIPSSEILINKNLTQNAGY